MVLKTEDTPIKIFNSFEKSTRTKKTETQEQPKVELVKTEQPRVEMTEEQKVIYGDLCYSIIQSLAKNMQSELNELIN